MKTMKNMKVFIRYLLIISVGVTLFAVTIFNIERNSIFIGGTHYHGTPPETAGYVSADKMADDPQNDKPQNDKPVVVSVPVNEAKSPVVVSASAVEEISHVVVSASAHEAKSPVVVSASVHEAKSPVVVSAPVHEEKSPVVVSASVHDEKNPVVVSASVHDEKNPVVVSASVHEAKSPVVVSAPVHEAKSPVVVSASAVEEISPVVVSASVHEAKSPVVVSASVHEEKNPLIHAPDKTPAPSIDIMIDSITKLAEILTQKYTSPANKDITPAKILSPDTITVSTDSHPAPLSFKGYLKTKNDSNTFTFSLDSACEVNISFTPSDGDKAYYVLSVHDSAGNTLTRKTIDSEKSYSDSGRLYLNAGKYTLKIQRGYSWSGKPYTLNVNTSHSADTESEPNNSPHTANTIPVNQDIPASSGTRNDTDYFAFTLDKPSSVTPSLKFNPVRFSKGIYRFKLYGLEILDTGKKPFIFRGDGTPSRKIKPFILEAGTYIISISRTESEELELSLHEYTLRVEAQEF